MPIPQVKPLFGHHQWTLDNIHAMLFQHMHSNLPMQQRIVLTLLLVSVVAVAQTLALCICTMQTNAAQGHNPNLSECVIKALFVGNDRSLIGHLPATYWSLAAYLR